MAVPVGLIIEASVKIIQESIKLMRQVSADDLSDDEKEMIRVAHANVQAETDRLLVVPKPPPPA